MIAIAPKTEDESTQDPHFSLLFLMHVVSSSWTSENLTLWSAPTPTPGWTNNAIMQNLVLQVAIYMWHHHLSNINENKDLSSSETAKCAFSFCIRTQISFIAACTIGLFSLLVIFWRLFLMAVCFFVSFSVQMYFLPPPASLQVMFHELMLRELLRSFCFLFYCSRFKREQGMFTCWHLKWSHNNVYHWPLLVCFPMQLWSCTKMQQ